MLPVTSIIDRNLCFIIMAKGVGLQLDRIMDIAVFSGLLLA